MDILDYWINLLNHGTDTEKGQAFKQLQALGYFDKEDELETWWMDVCTELPKNHIYR